MQITIRKLIEMNLNINNSIYVDDTFIKSLINQRQYSAFVPVSMCKQLNLPYISDPNLIMHTSIYLSSSKDKKLNIANLDMFKFIADYLKKNKVYYVVNDNSNY